MEAQQPSKLLGVGSSPATDTKKKKTSPALRNVIDRQKQVDGFGKMCEGIMDLLRQHRKGLRSPVLHDKLQVKREDGLLFQSAMWSLIDEGLILLTPDRHLVYNPMVE
jgi:hypothetical protein